MRSFLHVACFNILLSWTRAELFSAIAQIEPLLTTHEIVISDLDNYIKKEDERLAALVSHLETYRVEHEHMMKDVPNYLGSPIKVFTLIKRLTTDLRDIEDFIRLGKENVQNVTLHHSDVKYPTLQDVRGAAEAIARLQTTYRLAAHDLAEGRIQGVKRSNPMRSSDCFELCRVVYQLKNYQNTVSWCIEALRKYGDDEAQFLYEEVEILEYISFSYYMMGDVTTALKWTIKMLKLDPKHTRARHNVRIFKKAIAQKHSKYTEENQGKDTQNKNKMNIFLSNLKMAAAENNAALCRGEKNISSEIAKRLHCRYMAGRHPFRILAPFKVEQLYIDPDILLFHDVISDGEIEIIKNKATPLVKSVTIPKRNRGQRFVNVTVSSLDMKAKMVLRHIKSISANSAIMMSSRRSRTGFEISSKLISNSAWLQDESSPVVSRVSQRIADMSGLSVTAADSLHVANYGIGGHFSPHFDFTIANHYGKKIATVLFYLSDVEQGGATVFTELGLAVPPVKGTALFWHNLLPSGDGDLTTEHSACPVLRGSKWVSAKWLREAGQELLLPCNSKHQKEALSKNFKAIVFKMKHIFKIFINTYLN